VRFSASSGVVADVGAVDTYYDKLTLYSVEMDVVLQCNCETQILIQPPEQLIAPNENRVKTRMPHRAQPRAI
jgi:hypothetical protein